MHLICQRAKFGKRFTHFGTFALFNSSYPTVLSRVRHVQGGSFRHLLGSFSMETSLTCCPRVEASQPNHQLRKEFAVKRCASHLPLHKKYRGSHPTLPSATTP